MWGISAEGGSLFSFIDRRLQQTRGNPPRGEEGLIWPPANIPPSFGDLSRDRRREWEKQRKQLMLRTMMVAYKFGRGGSADRVQVRLWGGDNSVQMTKRRKERKSATQHRSAFAFCGKGFKYLHLFFFFRARRSHSQRRPGPEPFYTRHDHDHEGPDTTYATCTAHKYSTCTCGSAFPLQRALAPLCWRRMISVRSSNKQEYS